MLRLYGQCIRLNSPALLLTIAALALLAACGSRDDDTPASEGAVPNVVALVQSRPPDQAIDVVFIAEEAYGDMADIEDRLAFLNDLGPLVADGFWENQLIANNQTLFNFWYMTQTGLIPPGVDQPCVHAEWPDLDQAVFADVFVLIHAEKMRDCALGKKVTSEPESYRTVVHEVSHAAFGLPDEYAEARYWNIPPIFYPSEQECVGDAINSSWRDCVPIPDHNGVLWWRSENGHCDIMRCPGIEVLEFGPADWLVVRNILEGLGAGPANPPTIFAPDIWSAP